MKYRRLGRTNLKVSVIGVGTWQFGGEWGQQYTAQEAADILDRSKALGINLIDTAECYGDHLSEQLIGQYMKHQKRDDWVIATKFGHQFHNLFNRTDDFTPEGVVQQLDKSLQALQTDYVDLLQFHSGPNDAFDQDALWTALDKLKQAGKVRYLGISIGANDNIHQTSAATKVGADVIQVVYNRLERQPEAEVFPSCIEQDLGVLARVPLASGFLSGKYQPGAVFADNDVRSRRNTEDVNRKLEEVQHIREHEVPQGMDMATWALAWCLKHDAVTSVIPGCKNPEQVEANAKAAEYLGDAHPQAWKE